MHFEMLSPICFNLDQSKILSSGNWLTLSPNKPWNLRVSSISFLKTLWEKGKLLIMSNFSFSRSVFYYFGEYSATFIKFKIVVCRPFEFGKV